MPETGEREMGSWLRALAVRTEQAGLVSSTPVTPELWVVEPGGSLSIAGCQTSKKKGQVLVKEETLSQRNEGEERTPDVSVWLSCTHT